MILCSNANIFTCDIDDSNVNDVVVFEPNHSILSAKVFSRFEKCTRRMSLVLDRVVFSLVTENGSMYLVQIHVFEHIDFQSGPLVCFGIKLEVYQNKVACFITYTQ